MTRVSRKSEKIATLIAGSHGGGHDPHFLGYFDCFNRQLFYEAHDVLEELWLAQGRTGSNYSFYKGLIQLAGAYVHLQKNRLKPSVALFNLADANLRQYPAIHDGFHLTVALAMIADWRNRIESQGFQVNPLPGAIPPQLPLPPELSTPAIPSAHTGSENPGAWSSAAN